MKRMNIIQQFQVSEGKLKGSKSGVKGILKGVKRTFETVNFMEVKGE